jgi:hypothetical protein
MNLDEYKELTGLDVTDAQRAFVTANIARARVALEAALGFPLTTEEAQENLYIERGKTQSDYWPCDAADEDLLDPDNEPDAVYRLYRQPQPDSSTLQIDPCSAITRVKLVHGDVTVHTFAEGEYALRLGRSGLGRLVDLRSIFPNHWWLSPCSCNHKLQVAVDAAWLGAADADEDDESDLPDDLKIVWADQATWLSDKTRYVKSENRGTRSYTKAEIKSPLEDRTAQAILSRYAGPRGTAGQVPV